MAPDIDLGVLQLLVGLLGHRDVRPLYLQCWRTRLPTLNTSSAVFRLPDEVYQHQVGLDAPAGDPLQRVLLVYGHDDAVAVADEEGAGKQVRRERRSGAGEVRCKPVPRGCIGTEQLTIFFASNQSLQRNRCARLLLIKGKAKPPSGVRVRMMS